MSKKPTIVESGDDVKVWDPVWEFEREGTVVDVLSTQFTYHTNPFDIPRWYAFFKKDVWTKMGTRTWGRFLCDCGQEFLGKPDTALCPGCEKDDFIPVARVKLSRENKVLQEVSL